MKIFLLSFGCEEQSPEGNKCKHSADCHQRYISVAESEALKESCNVQCKCVSDRKYKCTASGAKCNDHISLFIVSYCCRKDCPLRHCVHRNSHSVSDIHDQNVTAFAVTDSNPQSTHTMMEKNVSKIGAANI